MEVDPFLTIPGKRGTSVDHYGPVRFQGAFVREVLQGGLLDLQCVPPPCSGTASPAAGPPMAIVEDAE